MSTGCDTLQTRGPRATEVELAATRGPWETMNHNAVVRDDASWSASDDDDEARVLLPGVHTHSPRLGYGSIQPRSDQLAAANRSTRGCLHLKKRNRRRLVAVAYFLLSMATFKHFEGWSWLDSLYFVSASVTTVGYGDVAPKTTEGRLIAMPIVLFGIIVVFSTVANAVTQSIESVEEKAMSLADADHDDLVQPLWVKVLFAVGLFIAFLFLGVLVLQGENKLSLSDKVWWSFQTITTCGFGDLRHPVKHWYTKLAAAAFMVISVAAVAVVVGQLASASAERRRQHKQQMKLDKIDLKMLRELDTDGGGVDRNEYILGMLKILGEVDVSVVNVLSAQFDAQDKDKNGFLDKDDLEIIAAQREAIIETQKKTAGTIRGGLSSADFRCHP